MITRRGASGIWWVEVRDAAKHPTGDRTGPHRELLSAQEGERLSAQPGAWPELREEVRVSCECAPSGPSPVVTSQAVWRPSSALGWESHLTAADPDPSELSARVTSGLGPAGAARDLVRAAAPARSRDDLIVCEPQPLQAGPRLSQATLARSSEACLWVAFTGSGWPAPAFQVRAASRTGPAPGDPTSASHPGCPLHTALRSPRPLQALTVQGPSCPHPGPPCLPDAPPPRQTASLPHLSLHALLRLQTLRARPS